MIKGLIVTHGDVGRELLKAAAQIAGPISDMSHLTLDWEDPADVCIGRIEKGIRDAAASDGLIIFTDMFGGTPSNLSLRFLEPGRIEIVTGVNLPMIVKFAGLDRETMSLEQIAQVVSERGAKAIRVASELLDKADEREPSEVTS